VSSGRGASTTAERTLQECARPATAKASFREVARWLDVAVSGEFGSDYVQIQTGAKSGPCVEIKVPLSTEPAGLTTD
jgi:hypothetical protein